jgi:hypothetical protein
MSIKAEDKITATGISIFARLAAQEVEQGES